VPEAAEALAISRSKLYELLASGAIDSIRIGGSRRIPLAALEETFWPVEAATAGRSPSQR
jgi:excisionase family DNA binding protein